MTNSVYIYIYIPNNIICLSSCIIYQLTPALALFTIYNSFTTPHYNPFVLLS